MFGYPEAYFTPPMEAVSRVELVRGAASLAYGPQFGGLLNFHIKGAPAEPIAVEMQQTVGAYGLFNSFIGLGGTQGKVSFYSYFQNRHADGWRANSHYSIYTGYASVSYAVTPKLSLGLQYTRMDYESQQPGGLTDSLFAVNPRQSLRSRNWFGTPWNVFALTLDYQLSEQLKLEVKNYGLIAERNSVGFVRTLSIADSINLSIGSHNPRQVDRDLYSNLGTEARMLWSYNLLGQQSTLAAGARLYRGQTQRKQLGVGTTGNDFDLSIATLTNGQEFGRSLDFVTNNLALFAENLFRIGNRLSVTPGLRYEMVSSTASGYISTQPEGNLPSRNRRSKVLLLGIGTEFQITTRTNAYANFSQAFRPVTFAELTPSTTTEVVDPDLEDVSGYNFDFGYRGSLGGFMSFDVGGFYMHYDNRIGTITIDDTPTRTNIGTSVSRGAEAYIEMYPFTLLKINPALGSLSLYTAYAFIDARYTSWNNPAIANDPARSIVGKRVENAPRNIARMGASYSLRNLSLTCQLNQIGNVYTDAANTEIPNASATAGRIEGFAVLDAALSYHFATRYNLRAGVNNLTNQMYATRRAGGYPGPGLMPANGRTWFISLGARF